MRTHHRRTRRRAVLAIVALLGLQLVAPGIASAHTRNVIIELSATSSGEQVALTAYVAFQDGHPVNEEDIVGVAYSPQNSGSLQLVFDPQSAPGYYGTAVHLDPGSWWVGVQTAAYSNGSQTLGFTVDGTGAVTGALSPAPVPPGLPHGLSMPTTTRAKIGRVLIAVCVVGFLVAGVIILRRRLANAKASDDLGAAGGLLTGEPYRDDLSRPLDP